MHPAGSGAPQGHCAGRSARRWARGCASGCVVHAAGVDLRRLSCSCATRAARWRRRRRCSNLSLAAGLYSGPVVGDKTVPEFGFYLPGAGVVPAPTAGAKPLAVVCFYRSYLTSADTDPVDAMIGALNERGFRAIGLFATSLKAPAASHWIAEEMRRLGPAAIVNATAFSAKGSDGSASPLDVAGCPVFQVALSTARRKEWATSDRGLSPADLAMHVVLPEVDGRIFAGVVSFKQPSKRDPDLQFSRFAHRADPVRVAAVADRVAGWWRLSQTAAADRKLAVILSTYPGKAHQLAHAVGLDALASTEAVLAVLKTQGYDDGRRRRSRAGIADRSAVLACFCLSRDCCRTSRPSAGSTLRSLG
jgi:cobaltochelatase CobN